MAEALYILCALTALGCTLLLLRAYRRTRVRLLMWGALCFGALTLNNVLLFADVVVFPESVELSFWRNAATLVGMAVMLWGMIWEAE